LGAGESGTVGRATFAEDRVEVRLRAAARTIVAWKVPHREKGLARSAMMGPPLVSGGVIRVVP